MNCFLNKYRKSCRIILWVLAVVVGIAAVAFKRVPLYAEESQTAMTSIVSKELMSGDVVEQKIAPTYDYLESVSVAIDYSEDTDAEQTRVLVEVLQGDEVLQSQELAVWVFGRLTFLGFHVGTKINPQEEIVIRITNTSELEDASFAMMATDLEYLYLDNTENFTHNGETQEGRLFTQVSYREGYDYYPALTYVFWTLGIALLISEGLLRKREEKTEEA